MAGGAPMIEMYLRLGLAIFPCHYPVINGTSRCSCGDPKCSDNAAKHPFGRFAPKGFKSASKDPRVIRRWADGPYNVAVATGSVSAIVVLDIDPRHAGDQSLASLEAEHGGLPHTWKALTGGGGEHYVFRHPGRPISCSEGKIAPGIDLRGDGGYAIIAPSRHISRRPYAWDVDRHPEHTPLADMPNWLLEKALAANGDTKPKGDCKRFADEPIAEGKRHDKLRSLAGLLFFRLSREPHLAARLLISFNQTQCDPPLPDEELARIIDHACAREIARRRPAP
jgi:putative DNA primase/helicase